MFVGKSMWVIMYGISYFLAIHLGMYIFAKKITASGITNIDNCFYWLHITNYKLGLKNEPEVFKILCN